VLWGVDLALLVALVRLRWRPWWQGLKALAAEPWRALELCTLANLAFLVGLSVVLWLALWFPLLLSSLAAVVGFLWWRRKIRLQARGEVAHA